MDPISEQNLSKINPVLAQKIRTAAEKCAESRLFFRVYSGLRTAEEQNALYAQGRETPGSIVTNARAGESMHNYGLAADIVPFMSNQSGALNWNPVSSQYRAMVKALKDEGLVWGGDWIHFKDLDHFQIQGLPPNPTHSMIADYHGGIDLQAIWDKAAKGEYA